jgi:acetoin utilization protein AcuC
VLAGRSNDWSGLQPVLGQTALAMYAGTARLVEKMLAGEANVAFNPQGAKHHAMRDRSSGFCVFNDMAWAARAFAEVGMRVMYVDWDAHHGDGVEALLYDSPDIITCSIHDGVIFPGTGRDGHKPDAGAYNWALNEGAGDAEFAAAMDDISMLADMVRPDVILLAAGADGHITDPLSTINFDYPGYHQAANTIADIALRHSDGRVLIGGAGGYQPHTHTPAIWADVVTIINQRVNTLKPISLLR